MANFHTYLPLHNRLKFNELLITAVERQPAIWASDYKDAKKIATIWADIAKELGTPEKYVIDRWRNLRDTYKKLLRKLGGSNPSDDSPKVRWPHFEQMSFVAASFAHRKISGNALERSVDDSVTADEDDNYCAALQMQSPAIEIGFAEHHEQSSCQSSASPSSDVNYLLGPSISSTNDSPSPPRDNPSQSSIVTRQPPRKKRRFNDVDCRMLSTADASGVFLETTSTDMQHVPAQLGVMTRDPIESFLYSLAPRLRDTPPHLLASLQMNLIYITSKYSQGIVPQHLWNFEDEHH